jgi:hypothetical protein
MQQMNVKYYFFLNTHFAEYVMTTIEQFRKLVERIPEIFEAVFPQAHIFEIAE